MTEIEWAPLTEIYRFVDLDGKPIAVISARGVDEAVAAFAINRESLTFRVGLHIGGQTLREYRDGKIVWPISGRREE